MKLTVDVSPSASCGDGYCVRDLELCSCPADCGLCPAGTVCSDNACVDLCPSDPSKTTPGICGCSSPDIDTDGDGVLDCHDAW